MAEFPEGLSAPALTPMNARRTPDGVYAHGADDKETHSDENSPDLVGEELADSARIWRVYDRVTREEDRERIGTWNRGLDNLALFAGLFSAVTTAFIIEAHQDTEPDYARLTFLVLNASAAGITFKEEPFVMDPIVRITYCLWIASLMLSLSAALIAIMGKDWIGTYASRPVCNPRQWAEIRTYRLACVDRWYMSGVIASAPVLLHLSLVFFAAGLVLFVAPDPFSQRVALGLSLAAGGVYLVVVLSAIIFPTSPFKSPATQAIRGAVTPLVSSLYDRLMHPRKRRPIVLLQQATLIIGAAFSYPSPPAILPFAQAQLFQHQGQAFFSFWNRLFSQNLVHLIHSGRNTLARLVRAAWAFMAASPRLVSGYMRSMLASYHYRRQRPRNKPWHASVHASLRRLDLSDRWAEVREQPTPDLLARSLSHLNATTQSMDVFHAILVALGDIAIGRNVAPLVSVDLQSRLRTQIRHVLPTTDLVTLSRFVLAAVHLGDDAQIPHWVTDRLTKPDGTIRSESVVFALVELGKNNYMPTATMNPYFPDIVTQPRAFQHLVPIVTRIEIFIVLAQRYWDPSSDLGSTNLEGHLRELLRSSSSEYIENQSTTLFGGGSGLIELLLVCMVNKHIRRDVVTSACALILKTLDNQPLFPSSPRFGRGGHSRLVYAFGHEDPRIYDAAWAVMALSYPLGTRDPCLTLEVALQLEEFLRTPAGTRVNACFPDEYGSFDMCLARTIVRLLFPSRNSCNLRFVTIDTPYRVCLLSAAELCQGVMQRLLCDHRSALDSDQRLEIISLIVRSSVLIRLCGVGPSGFGPGRHVLTKRHGINILTGIAHQIAVLLASEDIDDWLIGERLFCLFSHSETIGREGESIAWDLGSFLRSPTTYSPQYDPQGAVSLHRLLRALHALRPLCAVDDDLRAAWERIGLASEDTYHDSFWDCEDFLLGPLLSPEEQPPEEETLHEQTVPAPVLDESEAHYWLYPEMH